MISRSRGVGGFPLIGLALAIWGLSGGSAMAQGVGAGAAPYVYGGIPDVATPGFGTFGLGYHGFGLDYGHRGGCFPRPQTERGYSIHRWGAYVLGKECLDPYVADPYSHPAALGFWPPYSAPVAGAPY